MNIFLNKVDKKKIDVDNNYIFKNLSQEKICSIVKYLLHKFDKKVSFKYRYLNTINYTYSINHLM